MITPTKTSSNLPSKSDETGTKEEKIDLSNPVAENDKTESDMMLPHERDQTPAAAGTMGAGNEQSREVIKQAYDDTKEGLKDTDHRGIPSDINASDPASQSLTEDIRKNK
ncbi:hypothetical protein [Nitrosomonas communis]|uniref:Uncharacterized protein n=1 Tax=Nitrosomonas communis TaxID=44574 RepID=A0A1H2SKL0_9PROT|nr:hypothetical protein [Nitrosomonas communis]SDW32161.1 hypothetical protein SAMN05421882_1007106 [Nitrosomonas communis]